MSIVAAFVSRQSLTASQNKAHAPAAVQVPAEPVNKPVETRSPAPLEPSASAPSQPVEPAVAAPENLEPSPKQILSGPVRSLWESGKYAQALGLVNQVLAADPENADARAWKKKIRDAQAAEAALK